MDRERSNVPRSKCDYSYFSAKSSWFASHVYRRCNLASILFYYTETDDTKNRIGFTPTSQVFATIIIINVNLWDSKREAEKPHHKTAIANLLRLRNHIIGPFLVCLLIRSPRWRSVWERKRERGREGLENHPKTDDSCDNFAVVDRAGPHYSPRFFRGCDLLKQDRIPRMDWTAFRSHLGSWARCFFYGRHGLYSRREPFLPLARPRM